jgi:hypothetical protein
LHGNAEDQRIKRGKTMGWHVASGKIEKVPRSPQANAFWAAVLYGFVVLFVFGGAGIWLPASMPSKTVGVDALTTFVMATLAPVFVDLIIDAEIYGHKLTKLWRISCVAICSVAGALALVALVREHAPGEWLAGIVAVILSVLVWTALAIKSERFLQLSSTKGSIGGASPSPDNLSGGGL